MPRKRYQNKSFSPIGAVIDQVMRQYRPANDEALIKVWDVWDKAVGAAVAANARPVAFKGDMLLVHVANSTWLHHLRFLEKQMCDQVNEALGGRSVRTLKLKVGPL